MVRIFKVWGCFSLWSSTTVLYFQVSIWVKHAYCSVTACCQILHKTCRCTISLKQNGNKGNIYSNRRFLIHTVQRQDYIKFTIKEQKQTGTNAWFQNVDSPDKHTYKSTIKPINTYIVISIILIKPSILLIKMCTGNQSVTRQWGKQSWRKWIEFKTWKPSFDRQLSAIHYRLPNDFFSTPLMKCCSTFLCMTGDFSHNDTSVLPSYYMPLI